jgi:hypothetical protein
MERRFLMSRLILTTASLFAALCAFAQVKEDSLVATGMSSTYRGAVNEALVSALEQHDGVQVSSTEVAAMSASVSGVSTTSNGVMSETDRHELDDAIVKSMQKWAKGKILGYEVLSESFDPVTKKHRVELSVRFPGRYVVGRDPNDLRRMTVANFAVRSPTFKWYGQTVDSVEWSAALANQLNVVLTQTRKFTMLDRSFGKEIDGELARLGAANAAPGDVIRLNQKLAADYIVVGEVVFSDVAAPGVNPITGQALPQQSALFAEIRYRVLLAPTTQLKWADTVRLDALSFPAQDVRSFVSMSAEAAARAVCDGLMSNILPFEVVAVKSGLLVIGEGGGQLAVGDRFSVCALGDEVTDTRTGEVIDRMEIPVATAEIVSVRPKLSYAKVIEGDASKVAVGSRLRRIAVPAAAPRPIPVTTTVRPGASGGIVTPF